MLMQLLMAGIIAEVIMVFYLGKIVQGTKIYRNIVMIYLLVLEGYILTQSATGIPWTTLVVLFTLSLLPFIFMPWQIQQAVTKLFQTPSPSIDEIMFSILKELLVKEYHAYDLSKAIKASGNTHTLSTLYQSLQQLLDKEYIKKELRPHRVRQYIQLEYYVITDKGRKAYQETQQTQLPT